MKFNFWPTLIAVLATLILLRLGFWQLDRAEQKQQALELLERQQELHVEQWMALANKVDSHSQRVRLKGTIQSEQVWLLDNKVYQGQVGYTLITKFKLKGTEQQVLVDWGWIKAPVDRKEMFLTHSGEICRWLPLPPIKKKRPTLNTQTDSIPSETIHSKALSFFCFLHLICVCICCGSNFSLV